MVAISRIDTAVDEVRYARRTGLPKEDLMTDALSFVEIDGQEVELLPARTVLSLFNTGGCGNGGGGHDGGGHDGDGGGGRGGNGGYGGDGGTGRGGLGVNLLNINLFGDQDNSAGNGFGGDGGNANGGNGGDVHA
jgi:hypothetical protein